MGSSFKSARLGLVLLLAGLACGCGSSYEPAVKSGGPGSSPSASGGSPASSAKLSVRSGPWEIQVLRMEFVKFLEETTPDKGKSDPNSTIEIRMRKYDLLGSTPSDHLMVYLRLLYHGNETMKLQNAEMRNPPSFFVGGESSPLELDSAVPAKLEDTAKTLPLPVIRGVPRVEKPIWNKGESSYMLAVVKIPSDKASAIAGQGLRLVIRDFSPALPQVELPQAIPGKL